MASHVIGPLIVGDRPFTNDEATLLNVTDVWTFILLESPEPTTTTPAPTTTTALPVPVADMRFRLIEHRVVTFRITAAPVVTFRITGDY